MKKVTSVLMVDDDLDDREIFRDALKFIDPSLKITFAENGIEALQKIQAGECIPDIIFSDINMPVMNGLEFLAEIKQKESLRDIPVIIYTTSPSQNFKSKCNQMGAAHYIIKPSGFETICAEITTAFEKTLHIHYNLDTKAS